MVFCKKGVLTNFAKFTKKSCAGVSFEIKVADLQRVTLSKKTPAQVFSSEFFVGNFSEYLFIETLPTTGSASQG